MTDRLFEVHEPWTLSPESIIAKAVEDHAPVKTFLAFSGGNDSIVLLHYALAQGWDFDGVVHVNTGTGVCEGGGIPYQRLCPRGLFGVGNRDD